MNQVVAVAVPNWQWPTRPQVLLDVETAKEALRKRLGRVGRHNFRANHPECARALDALDGSEGFLSVQVEMITEETVSFRFSIDGEILQLAPEFFSGPDVDKIRQARAEARAKTDAERALRTQELAGQQKKKDITQTLSVQKPVFSATNAVGVPTNSIFAIKPKLVPGCQYGAAPRRFFNGR